MNKVQGPTVRKTLTVATSRISWQPLIILVVAIVVMSVVVLSGQELKHVPPAAPTLSVLYRFAGPPTDGAHPFFGGLVRDAAGNLYGTTPDGGAAYEGVVFKLSPAGTETVLRTFTGIGSGTNAGLILDSAGNLYGTTPTGGVGLGMVFKLSSGGSAFKVLYSFTGGADGRGPLAGVIQDAAGNLYGTTTGGGSSGAGVVFELIRCDSEPSGYEFKVLYTFTGGTDGRTPYGGLVLDAAGNLYGTTFEGGSFKVCSDGCGTVFKLSPNGTETVLHSFTGGDGALPTAGLILDPAGNLYGTTFWGGGRSDACRFCGVVFRLAP